MATLCPMVSSAAISGASTVNRQPPPSKMTSWTVPRDSTRPVNISVFGVRFSVFGFRFSDSCFLIRKPKTENRKPLVMYSRSLMRFQIGQRGFAAKRAIQDVAQQAAQSVAPEEEQAGQPGYQGDQEQRQHELDEDAERAPAAQDLFGDVRIGHARNHEQSDDQRTQRCPDADKG